MSNASMPGIYKVGMTLREPTARLAEANRSDTWRPPTDYDLEYAVRVCDALATEKKLHRWLEDMKSRVHPRREFFDATLQTIRILFDHLDTHVVQTESDSETMVAIVEVAISDGRRRLRSGRIVG